MKCIGKIIWNFHIKAIFLHCARHPQVSWGKVEYFLVMSWDNWHSYLSVYVAMVTLMTVYGVLFKKSRLIAVIILTVKWFDQEYTVSAPLKLWGSVFQNAFLTPDYHIKKRIENCFKHNFWGGLIIFKSVVVLKLIQYL